MAGLFSTMRPNGCLTILRVSVCAALLLTLDADSEESDCGVEVNVDRDIVYEAVLGEDLRIHCTVEFCSGSPPTVSWYKRERTDHVPVNVSSSSHIKTEWKLLKHLEGRSFLIFQKVRRNDSGEYQCEGGGSLSHYIDVSVHGELTNVAVMASEMTSEMTSELVTEDTFWPFVFRAVGTTVFFILMLTLCVASRRKCRATPSRQPSHDALPPSPIYENSQPCLEINPLS
ncbi:uncharacterized protein LOC142952810 isoform X2 [Anarhichas minor]|uniref:uncharacterized protein LOC142952810 isoform X2 n=1 Tax=Anarhichas minor TaxID=65739 RepID=UPI003F741B7C